MYRVKTRVSIVLALLICASLAIVFLPGCKKKSDPVTYAKVMFVNGCSGSATISAKVNNSSVQDVSTIIFPGNTGYRNVISNTNLKLDFYGTKGSLLSTANTNLSTNANYSFYAGGLAGASSVTITTDELSAPSKGKAKVRFINLSSDNLNEDFIVGGQKLDSNIYYMVCSPFHEITGGDTVNVLIQDPFYVQPAYIAQLSKKVFAAGKIYTIMLSGTYLGTNGSFLRLTIINNN